jgi:hypothetical protein
VVGMVDLEVVVDKIAILLVEVVMVVVDIMVVVDMIVVT